jgi:hypothetical protein
MPPPWLSSPASAKNSHIFSAEETAFHQTNTASSVWLTCARHYPWGCALPMFCSARALAGACECLSEPTSTMAILRIVHNAAPDGMTGHCALGIPRRARRGRRRSQDRPSGVQPCMGRDRGAAGTRDGCWSYCFVQQPMRCWLAECRSHSAADLRCEELIGADETNPSRGPRPPESKKNGTW